MLEKIDHIGIAVYSIDQARPFYEQVLGLSCERIETVADQGVRVALFSLGGTRIELLEPLDAASPVARFLEKRGQGVHHIAYRSDDLEEELGRARSHGCRLIDDRPRQGADGKLIAFLHPASTHGVLTEICTPGQPENRT